MSLRNLARPVLALAERLVTALLDPARRERIIAGLLVAYAAIWTLFAVISRSSRDIHYDMGEMAAWANESLLGHPKHPQFAAWVAAFWFSVFPHSDWAFYLLGIGSATLALWVSWRLSARWLDDKKRIVGLALLTLVPFFNIYPLRYNVNTILISLWAITTLWFLHSFVKRSLPAAAFAGIGAAASMMGKYWSIFLLAGLGLAAIIDPRRRAYFRSPAPWVTMAAGALAISPYIYWLAVNHFSPLEFPMLVHGTSSLRETTTKAAIYLAAFAGFIALPTALVFLSARPSPATILDLLWPRAAERRLVVVAFLTPVLLPVPVALVIYAKLELIWTMSACALLPVVLLSSPVIVISRVAVIRIVAIAIAVPVLALAVAPVTAIWLHRKNTANFDKHYSLIAKAVERTWHETSAEPIRLVGSYSNLIFGASFYFADRPSVLALDRPQWTPWADDERIDREGIALVCPRGWRQGCLDAVDVITAKRPASRRVEVEIVRNYLGLPGKPVRYVIIIVPPRR
jgi:4-amino-4-deoxy-L-arabinose transferase-like glycosyltransferase